jgi:hypothetical protein
MADVFGNEAEVLLDVERLKTENAKLKEFARDIITDECWDLGGSQSRDGVDVQDWAEKLGLIVKGKATAEQAEASNGLCEEGDDWYTFSDILKD